MLGPDAKARRRPRPRELVATLPDRDRELLALRYQGHGLVEIAERHRRSTSYTFARLRALGRELAERADVALVAKPPLRRPAVAA